MEIHHLGIACNDIFETTEYLQKTYSISHISDRVHDENQDADLLMVYFKSGIPIELICGKAVEQFLKRNIKLYHICYEVPNLEKSIDNYIQSGALLISPPKKAVLFKGKRVAFLSTLVGFVELLEI